MNNDHRVKDLPEGVQGNWSVERFIVSPDAAERTRLTAILHGRGYVPPGAYTRLMCGGEVVMSDTPDEIRDHLAPIHNAKGGVLINGLGIGMVLNGVLSALDDHGNMLVDHATVVELNEDVITLVGPHYQKKYGDRVTIVHGDALTHQPPKGQRYGMVWHDIWTYICEDNLPDMHKLHRKYGRRADWQGSWCRWHCENAR